LVHVSFISRTASGGLHEGRRISFEPERGQQGRVATVNLKQV
jgi:cold shock CspA family protein